MKRIPADSMRVVDYGALLRVGLLIPSGNSVAEPEIHAMLPPGVAALITRLELRGSSEAELLHMIDGLEAAARLLADAQVALVAFHCTAVSTFAPYLAADIQARIHQATGLPAFSTSDAIVAALVALGARRVALLTPYVDEVHAREASFLSESGATIVGSACLGINTNAEMALLTPAQIAAFVRRNACEDAEAYLVSCTAIRSAGVIASLEQELGAPVITSNQALVWYLLRSQGVTATVDGFGMLFEKGA